MEHLRDGIGLRGYGQRDPKQEYKKEGYDIFVSMMATRVEQRREQGREGAGTQGDRRRALERRTCQRHTQAEQQMILRHGAEVDPGADDEPEAGGGTPSARPPAQRVIDPQRREGPKIGRNDPCPCGSGLKFKKCHGAALEEEGAADD